MRTWYVVVSVILGLAALAIVPGQGADRSGNKDRWLAVKKWTAEIKITTRGQEVDDKKDRDCVLSRHYESQWSCSSRITGSLDEFEHFYESDGSIDTGRWSAECRASGDVDIRYTLKEQVPPGDKSCQNLSYTMSIQGSGTDADPNSVDFEIDNLKGTYGFRYSAAQITTARNYKGVTDSWTDAHTSPINKQWEIMDIPIPSGPGTVLTGLRNFTSKSGTIASEGESVQVAWRFTPGDLEDLELEVEPRQFDSWIPQGGEDEETPGNELVVDVNLRTKDGKDPREKARKITFELVNTSRIPGVCCNYPEVAVPDHDFKLDPKRNEELSIKDRWKQKAETADGEYARTQVILSCYDWGGYTRLKVTARMPDGRDIEGHLKGDEGQTEIRIPKRKEDSMIAEAWKRGRGVESKADGDDDEEDPKLDGHAGDGLTLYEEYRGFYENGRHFHGDPKRKEIFVLDKIGRRSKDGISLFVAATRLVVHHRLREAETSRTNAVVNANFDKQVPRLADKWAIVMIPGTQRGPSYGKGQTGGPKEVEMSPSFSPGPGGWNRVRGGAIITDEYAVTIAHEMLHCSGVSHHGDVDLQKRTWRKDRNDAGLLVIKEYAMDDRDVVSSEGQVIRVLTEDGREVGPNSRALILPEVFYVARYQGEHSGMEDCILRYDVADAYVSRTDPSVRYLSGDEMAGLYLCEDARGTGVNDAARRPRSRYGPAARGNCLGQACANDSIKH